jgi:Cu-Zn family superoxide dismutase
MNLNKLAKVGCLLIVLIVSGCSSNQSVRSGGHPGAGIFGTQNEIESGPKAVAYLAGYRASGTVVFTAVQGGVRIQAGIMGLAPGLHAFHVYETGDCSALDDAPSGLDSSRGNLGNFAADATGEIHLDFIDSQISLTGTNSILGHALMVHSGAENDSGPQVACGVIQMQ